MSKPPCIETTLSGWGRFPSAACKVVRPERSYEIEQYIDDLNGRHVISRGSGLAYGDAALNTNQYVLLTTHHNNFLSFDPDSGVITCQSGVKLEDILSVAIPHGWFLPVTPGTARASAGGCMACDVHGKNHHASMGSFANHVTDLHILTGSGERIMCNQHQHPEIFWATAGGMGLTGIILQMSIQLMQIESTTVLTRNISTSDLEDTLDTLKSYNHYSYSVAWIDGNSKGRKLGKGVVMLGEHAASETAQTKAHEPKLIWNPIKRHHLPVGLPGFMLNKYISKLFNAYVYKKSCLHNDTAIPVSIAKYFYPLDTVDNWNKLYGRKGFIEYQVVVPEQNAPDVFRLILENIEKHGYISFLTSMKRMGPGNNGYISFPIEGYSLSIDVPNRDHGLFKLLDYFDDAVAEAGGRVYLAKDARLNKDALEAMYPRLSEWREIVCRIDPEGRFSSDMGRRLGLSRQD